MSAANARPRAAAPRAPGTFNPDESPIAWLRRRKDRSGEADDLTGAVRRRRAAARRFLVRADDAAHDDELVVAAPHATRPAPRRGAALQAPTCSTARRGRAERVRRALAAVGPGAVRRADRRVLSPEGFGGGRARRRLAAAVGEDRAATGADGAGAPLRLGDARATAGAGARRCAIGAATTIVRCSRPPE